MAFKLKNLLKNKYILYIVFFMAITNVLGYLSIGDFRSLTIFVAIALLSTYFSKNMIVNLISAMVFTNLLFAGKTLEGMANKKKEEKKEAMKHGDKHKNGKQEKNTENGVEGKEENGKEKESFGQRNVPKSTPASYDDDDMDIGKRIDYASTLEQAYSNLQGVLGKDGVSGLTKETEKLINQQKSLMGTLNEMIPFIKDTKKTLGSFNMGDLNKSMSSISNMIGTMKQ